MDCPSCAHDATRVVDSRVTDEGSAVRRRRVCAACNGRFTTYERVHVDDIVVEKRNGDKEPFDPEKVLRGLRKALEKRPVPEGEAERLARSIEAEVNGSGRSKVTAQGIGEMVCERLIEVDEVAYLRFASVYKEFSDAEHFAEELQLIKERR